MSKTLKSREAPSITLSDEKNDELMEKTHSTILSCLSNEVLYEVVENDMIVKLWLKVESLYMMKFLTIHLYLKKQLFTFQMKEDIPLKEYIDEFNKLSWI